MMFLNEFKCIELTFLQFFYFFKDLITGKGGKFISLLHVVLGIQTYFFKGAELQKEKLSEILKNNYIKKNSFINSFFNLILSVPMQTIFKKHCIGRKFVRSLFLNRNICDWKPPSI